MLFTCSSPPTAGSACKCRHDIDIHHFANVAEISLKIHVGIFVAN